MTAYFRTVLCVISMLLVQIAAAAELRPIDEGSHDPSFVQFRKQLLELVARKDMKALLANLSPEIKNSFGGDGGVAEFTEMWKGRHTKLWRELTFILRNGGKLAADGDFCGPYIFSHWPERFDPFEHYVALTARNVSLKSTPTEDSPTVATLSYTIVKVLEDRYWEKTDKMVHISANGADGFVPRARIRSPIDYRACFGRKNGKWALNLLVAGD